MSNVTEVDFTAAPDDEVVDEARVVPILRVWKEVLAPAAAEADRPITAQWCVRMIGSYPDLTYAKIPRLSTLYFGLINSLAEALQHEINLDEDCLTYSTAEDDMEYNRAHYLNVLLNWQLLILETEMEWNPLQSDAAEVVAALSEVHKLFFGQNGITEFLHNTGFVFTEEDALRTQVALDEMRSDRE